MHIYNKAYIRRQKGGAQAPWAPPLDPPLGANQESLKLVTKLCSSPKVELHNDLWILKDIKEDIGELEDNKIIPDDDYHIISPISAGLQYKCISNRSAPSRVTEKIEAQSPI